MNDIIFAGSREHCAEQSNKCTEIIAPCGDGCIICGNDRIKYTSKQIIVIAPLVKYRLTEPQSDDIHVLCDRALFKISGATVIDDVDGGGIRHAAAQAARFFTDGNNARSLVLAALGDLIAGYVSYSTGGGKRSPVTELVVAEVDNGLTHSGFSLDDVIKKLPLNGDYVRKLFKKEVGITPHEYLVKCRMELAAKILLGNMSNRYSNYTVSQVAEACGYSDPLYFSRSFKKYYGVSPSEYS